MMAAYLILQRLRMRDKAEFDLYASQASQFSVGHKVKRLANLGAFEVLEGAAIEGVVVLEFPSFAEAKAWYESSVYQEASRHRHQAGDFSVVIVEGVPA